MVKDTRVCADYCFCTGVSGTHVSAWSSRAVMPKHTGCPLDVDHIPRDSGAAWWSLELLWHRRIADLGQQLHCAEPAAVATEKIDLKSIGVPTIFDGQASGSRDFGFEFVAYCCAMDEASRSEVPILTGSMRQGEGARSGWTALLHACALVRWWSVGGHGERT